MPVGEDAEGDGEADVADGGEEGRIRVARLGRVPFEPMAVHVPDVAVEGDAVDEEADGDGDEAVEVDGDFHFGLRWRWWNGVEDYSTEGTMKFFLSRLFAAQEKIGVEAETAAPLVNPSPSLPAGAEDSADAASGGEGAADGTEAVEALARVLLLERKCAEYADRLATVERRLIEVGAQVEEWRGE